MCVYAKLAVSDRQLRIGAMGDEDILHLNCSGEGGAMGSCHRSLYWSMRRRLVAELVSQPEAANP
jgi:hypothetical protein